MIEYFGPFGVYLLLTAYGLTFEGWKWKLLAFLPLLPMIAIAGEAVYGYFHEWNLWPVGIMFASPLAVFYIVCVIVLYWLLN